MSIGSVIGSTLRALVIAAATGAAAFGLLVVFQPFGKTAPTAAVTVTGSPEATALQGRIEALRVALRDSETALDAAKATSATASPDAASRAQYDAQIAAATERRDLALRHAEAIRTSLDAGVTPSSLAEIRDSVVIGQLLSQQVALDARIATDGARFRANHPTMRALTAQRNALTIQIGQEAANIAAALESEAKIDDAQIKGFLVAPKAEALQQLAEKASPAAILLPSTFENKEVAGRLAIKLGSGLITDAVERELTARGISKAAPGGGDVLVSYSAFGRSEVDLNATPMADGTRREQSIGTLTVDLRDAVSREVLFRARVDTPIETDRATIETAITAAVAAVFEKYPGPAKR